MSHSTVGRVERGREPEVSVELLARLAAVVGLDMTLRFYPGGDPVRDTAHMALLDRLRARIHPGLRWRTEVPLALAGDRRAWDAVISGSGWAVGVEAETRLRDLQAVQRKIALKARDGELDHVVLLVADTRGNRLALRQAQAPNRATVPQRDLLAALSAGRDPASGGTVIL